MASTGFFDYIKSAFMNHWNLMIFGAGVVKYGCGGAKTALKVELKALLRGA